MHVNPNRIKQARHKAGLSQDALARAVATSARNVVRWENGKNQPRAEFVAAVAAATGQELGFFFSSDDQDEDGGAELDAQLLAALRRWRAGIDVPA